MNELSGKIQDSELEVMRILWEAGDALPLIEIRRALSARCGWEDSTIKTLLRRLQAKGIVKLERRGVYGAVVTKEEYNQWSTKTFVNKIFAGSAKKLVASLVSGGQLDEKDIAELSAMFNAGEEHE
ncbi:BlaI/MecI/CopY family transcriptional regulator [Candidatus Formimonas warabiya]|uniref:CopY family transcriptional regulator n=1 Tax=Formimonas warabiya TaxID=1761012 RepID=A0A3G1KRU4_FORW1|nr:BlaI/MecI/CopY family transcriptional regulator [Candidatus Formimonas warabiya]ATW25166.1 CopY family transcriptional regulator [Candidatus Formimonas warabiya]